MGRHGCKRSRHFIDGQQHKHKEAMANITNFPLLELPFHIICNIFARLPLKNILRCRCICNTLLKLLKDPYFSKIHLSIENTFTTNLILTEKKQDTLSFLHFLTFDGGKNTISPTSCHDQNSAYFPLNGTSEFVNYINFMYSPPSESFTVISSCNGLLCMNVTKASVSSFYGVFNPLLSEFIKLPRLTASPPLYNDSNHAGFGYCPRTKEYKVISFRHTSTEMVAFVHTLGTDSWKKVENAPYPKRDSFDPHVNGALHWITSGDKFSELISSFVLESEKFKTIPSPAHLNQQYVNKVSSIDIGVVRNCLCICYTYKGSEFEVWVMREYGVQESWTKEFSIEMKLYPKLRVEDYGRPIRFLNNGDLCFILSSGALVFFSPKKRTFTELRGTLRQRTNIRQLSEILGRNTEVTLYDLSFISLKDVMGTKRTLVRNLRLCRRIRNLRR